MIYNTIIDKQQAGKKQLAILIDPDKGSAAHVIPLAQKAEQLGVDLLFVGGSLLVKEEIDGVIDTIKAHCNIPVVLFPGSPQQVTSKADGLLFLSLISGRNADLLIGQQVIAAPAIKRADIEVIPTGYMLIDGGRPTTASYISNSLPIPANKPEIAAITAMAGEMLGLKLIYCDAGSGADNPVPHAVIKAVRNQISSPLVIGGGIRTPEGIARAFDAGADIVVVGNVLEHSPSLLEEMIQAKNRFSPKHI